MSWLWFVGAAWLMLGVLIGVLIGQGIRLADRKEAAANAADTPNFVVEDAPRGNPVAESIPRQAAAPPAERQHDPRRASGA